MTSGNYYRLLVAILAAAALAGAGAWLLVHRSSGVNRPGVAPPVAGDPRDGPLQPLPEPQAGPVAGEPAGEPAGTEDGPVAARDRLPAIEVTGTVVRSETAEPLAGVDVAFRPAEDLLARGVYPEGERTGTTSRDGRFTVNGLAEGVHDVVLSARRHLRKAVSGVDVAAGGEGLRFSLERGHAVSGRALDAAGRPVAGARVRIDLRQFAESERSQLLETESTTEVDGSYRIEGLLPRDGYTLFAAHEDHALAWVSGVRVGPDADPIGADFRLEEGWSIRGRILDEQGRAVPGATVRADVVTCGIDTITPESVVLSGIEMKEATSGAEGEYEIPRLAGGCYIVSALAEGFLPQREERVRGGASAEHVVFHLRRSATVRGRVVDGSGSLLGGARVSTAWPGGTDTDERGAFILDGLHGRVWVTASLEGFEDTTAIVRAPAEDVSLVLLPLAVIAGRVRAAGQEGSVPVSVRALGEEGREWAAGVLAGGEFAISLPAGRYVLQAEAAGFAPARSRVVAVGPGERREGIVLDLGPEAVVKGKVVVRDSGEPLAAAVSFQPATNLWLHRATGTDWDGSFELRGLPSGEFELEVTPQAWAIPGTVLGPFRLEPGEARELLLEVGRGGGIRGVFRDAGEPPGGRFRQLNASVWRDGDEITRLRIGPGGRFDASGLPPGDLGVSVWGTRSDGGALHVEETVSIRDGQVTGVRIDAPDRIPVEGRVTSEGRPRAGVAIAAVDPWRDPEMRPHAWWDLTLASATTDGEGMYGLALERGTRCFLILAEPGERGRAQVEVEVPRSRVPFRYDVALPPGTLEGVVVEKGTIIPVPDVLVEALDAARGMRSYLALARARRGCSRTDGEGRFAIGRLPPGTYSVRVASEYSVEAWAHGVVVTGEDEARVRIEVDAGFPGSLRVLDRRGYPVTGTSVLVRDRDGNLVGAPWQDAVFSLPPEPSGVYELTVVHPRHAPARLEVSVDGRTRSRTVILSPGGSLRTIVADPAGRPVPGAEIRALDGDGRDVFDDRIPTLRDAAVNPHASSLTTEDGVVLLEHLGAGPYRVAATKETARSDEARVTIVEGEVATVRLVLSER